MESFPGDEEGSTDDLTGGKRKSKLKTLKICLFGRTKRETKFSQSASDVTEAKGLGSTDNLCSGMLGSRALSHDSIFLVDQDLASPEHPRVLSQENVHGRIKELQMKLLQQNLHLGPPPLVLPIKHSEDLGGSSEDDGLPHTPPEISIGNNRAPRGVSYKASSQLSSHPRSPVPKAPLTCSVPPTSSVPHSAFSPALDFSTPAQFTPCLDNSAARHRMSIKPRNQRASAKNKRLNMTESRPRSESLNNFDRPLTEEGPAIPGGRTRLRCQSTLILKPQQGVSNTPIAPPKTSTPTFPCKPSPQEQPHPGVPVVSPAPKTRTLPGAKQPQPSSVTTVQDLKYTPQQQTLKQSLGDPKPPDPSQTKRDVLSKLTPSNASRKRQEQQGARREGDKPNEEELTAIDMGGNVSEGEEVEEESGEGVEDAVEAKEETQEEGKREFGGNLHSISLSLRVLAEADTSQSDLKIKHHSAEVGALPLSPYTPSSKHTGLEGLRDTPPTRANSMPKKLYTNNWDAPTTLSSSRGRAGSLREADTATSAQSTPSPLTKEAQTTPATPKEDQTIPVLPIEAQATSLAPQDTPISPQAAPQAAVSWMSMAWGKTRGLQQLFTSSLPREFIGMQSPTQPQAQTTTQPQTPSLAKIVTQTQRQNTTQPQTQTTTPPQAQTTTQPQSQTTMQPLTAKLLQSQNAAQPRQTAAQAPTQTTKHLQTTKTPQTQNATQPRTTTQPSTHNSKPSTQTSNQINTREEQPTATQPLAQSTLRSVSQVTSQSSRRANQPTLCSTPQTQSQASLRIAPMGATSTQPPAPSTLSSSPRSTPSQPPWSAQGLNPIPQPKPASAPTTTPVQPLVRGERTPCDQGKSEGAAVSTERWVDWDRSGSVGGTAAFMEKRAEWTPPAGSKVEFRRTRTPPESQPTAELAAPPKATHTHRDTKDANLDRRPESRPTIVTGRLADREDKWLRKNMPTSSSPSSSLLQAISDSGDQPSWMELAKRKSMAWNDNTMD